MGRRRSCQTPSDNEIYDAQDQGVWRHAGPQHPLCLTCRRATVVRGHSLISEIVHCHALERTMKFPVRECDSYEDQGSPRCGT
jgi:hypothetical protein